MIMTAARRPAVPAAESADGRAAHSNNITQPTVMPISATLNTGQNCRSMKSTTAPRSNPGSRNTRSARLPTAPPRSRPMATATGRRDDAAPVTMR